MSRRHSPNRPASPGPRRSFCALPVIASLLCIPAPSTAQTQSLGSYQATPPESIDLSIPEEEPEPDPQAEARCRAQQEAAIISNEIVVCGDPARQAKYRIGSRKDAQDRYARETTRGSEFGLPEGMPLEMIGPGIFKGPATVSGLCVIPPCPPPPAYMVDFDELPEPPEGSDADLIAKGQKRLD
jgi:hypothetical protein